MIGFFHHYLKGGCSGLDCDESQTVSNSPLRNFRPTLKPNNSTQQLYKGFTELCLTQSRFSFILKIFSLHFISQMFQQNFNFTQIKEIHELF